MLLQESDTALLDETSLAPSRPTRLLVAAPLAVHAPRPIATPRPPQREAVWALDIALDRMMDDVLAREASSRRR